MIINNMLNMKIMEIPFRDEWADNEVLFITYYLEENTFMFDANFEKLNKMKPEDNPTVGDMIFTRIVLGYQDVETYFEVFTDQESIKKRVAKLKTELKKKPDLAPLVAMMTTWKHRLPSRKDIGYSLG